MSGKKVRREKCRSDTSPVQRDGHDSHKIVQTNAARRTDCEALPAVIQKPALREVQVLIIKNIGNYFAGNLSPLMRRYSVESRPYCAMT